MTASTETKHRLYRVTPDGRVISLSGWRGFGEFEMVQTLNASGYPSVRIVVDGKRKHIATHRLVAAAHLEPRPSPDHEIRHLDGDKLNSSGANLAWGTSAENAADRERHGRTSRGASHSASIRASNQAEATRAFRSSQRALTHG